ncbi:hypothetical protein A4S05_09660 [Nostoc sp. KVJ20]|nr:hypothetical protein A4S05_09660 [Nostoc sp. KVJ20]
MLSSLSLIYILGEVAEQGKSRGAGEQDNITNAQCPIPNAQCPIPNAQFNKLTLINDNSLVKSVSVISLSSTL